MKRFSITIKNVAHVLQDFFFDTAIYMVTLLFLVYFLRNDEREFIIFIIGLVLLLYVPFTLLPVLILLYNYDQKNAGMEIKLSKGVININSELITEDKIEKIIVYGTHQHFHHGYSLIAYAEQFFYLEMKLVDKRIFYITCLMSPEIDNELKRELQGVEYVEKIKVFPII